MLDIINAIKQALTDRLKRPGFKVRLTRASLGYKQPTVVYYELEYSLADGSRAFVSTDGINEEGLTAHEDTISKIMGELQGKYIGRSRR